jgi:hypothetical protein
MLRNHGEYYEIVPDYIIKYEMYDIFSTSAEADINVNFSLDNNISSKVLEKLRYNGDKCKVIQLYNIIDDLTMIQTLKDALEEPY